MLFVCARVLGVRVLLVFVRALALRLLDVDLENFLYVFIVLGMHAIFYHRKTAANRPCIL